MVEGQVRRQVVHWKNPDFACIVSGFHLFRVDGLGRVNGSYGVLAGITPGIGVDAEKTGQLDIQAGFFPSLPHSGLLSGFAMVDEPPGQGPARWRIAALDEHYSLSGDVDKDVHRGDGIEVILQQSGAV